MGFIFQPKYFAMIISCQRISPCLQCVFSIFGPSSSAGKDTMKKLASTFSENFHYREKAQKFLQNNFFGFCQNFNPFMYFYTENGA